MKKVFKVIAALVLTSSAGLSQIDLSDSTFYDNDKVLVQYRVNDWFNVVIDTSYISAELLSVDSTSADMYDTYTFSLKKDSTILLQGVKASGWSFQDANVSDCKVLFLHKGKLAEIKLSNAYGALNVYEYKN